MALRSTILGRAKLERKLKRLPEAAKEAIRVAMASAADDITDMMRSLVPYKTGALYDSIGWSWGPAPKGSLIVAQVKGKLGSELTITIYAGSRDKSRGDMDAYWARWVEFGTVKMKAQPYFFVSWRANRKSAVAGVRKATRKAARDVAAGK